MAPRRSRRRGIVAGPLVLSGLGLLAGAALFVARTGREVAARKRGDPLPDRRVGVAPIALLSGLDFLLLVLLR